MIERREDGNLYLNNKLLSENTYDEKLEYYRKCYKDMKEEDKMMHLGFAIYDEDYAKAQAIKESCGDKPIKEIPFEETRNQMIENLKKKFNLE